MLRSCISYFGYKDPIKVPNSRLVSALVNICNIPHAIFQTASQFCLQIFHCYSVSWKITHLYLFLELWVFRSKFTKFFSFLKHQISFSSNFVSFFSVVRHNSSILFSWSFKYFQQKESTKVKIWCNFTWAAESLKFCTFFGSFCPNHIKLQLKKYRGAILHNAEEWYKVYMKTDLRFQIWHEEFGEFSPSHSKEISFQWTLFVQTIQSLSYKTTVEPSFMSLNSDAIIWIVWNSWL